MAGEYWLGEEAWAAIDPLLPKVCAGARRQDDRRIIGGIVHVLRSGWRWIDCPAVYGPYTTVYNRSNRWNHRGRWQAIFEALVPTAASACSHRCCGGSSRRWWEAAASSGRRRSSRPSPLRCTASAPMCRLPMRGKQMRRDAADQPAFLYRIVAQVKGDRDRPCSSHIS